MVEGVLGCGHQPADEVHEDHLEQDGGDSLTLRLPHKQRQDRGGERFHKGPQAERLRLPGLRLFRTPDLGADA